MGSSLANVVPIHRPIEVPAAQGLLTKPCTFCERPAAYRIETTTGLDDDPAVIARSCIEHLSITIEFASIEAERWNAGGLHAALFPWLVTVARYQR
jgi:hypothetical protein